MAHTPEQTKKLSGQPTENSYRATSSTPGLASQAVGGIPGSIGGVTQESLTHGNDTVDYFGRVPHNSSISVAGSTGPSYPERLWSAYDGSMRPPLQPYDQYIDTQQQGYSSDVGNASKFNNSKAGAGGSFGTTHSNEAGEQTQRNVNSASSTLVPGGGTGSNSSFAQ